MELTTNFIIGRFLYGQKINSLKIQAMMLRELSKKILAERQEINNLRRKI